MLTTPLSARGGAGSAGVRQECEPFESCGDVADPGPVPGRAEDSPTVGRHELPGPGGKAATRPAGLPASGLHDHDGFGTGEPPGTLTASLSHGEHHSRKGFSPVGGEKYLGLLISW